MDFDAVVVEELAFKLALDRYRRTFNPETHTRDFEQNFWFHSSRVAQVSRNGYRDDAKVFLKYVEALGTVKIDGSLISALEVATPAKHKLWRKHQCSSGHVWESRVKLATNTHSSSGEMTEYCSDFSCHAKAVWSSPVFVKDGEPWLLTGVSPITAITFLPPKGQE